MLPLCPQLVGIVARCDVVDVPFTDLKRCSCGTFPISKEPGICFANFLKVSSPIAILSHPVSMVAHPSSSERLLAVDEGCDNMDFFSLLWLSLG